MKAIIIFQKKNNNKIPINNKINPHTKCDVFYPNVYKFSIKLKVNFDIIDKALHIRNRKDGDSYRSGGMTRRLKKLFNDINVPPSVRNRVPVFCINGDILYVPGFSVADKFRGENELYINVFEKESKTNIQHKFFYPRYNK